MRKIYFLLFFMSIAFGCGRNDYTRVEWLTGGISAVECPLDTSLIKELFVPSDIYSVGMDILVVNGSKDRHLFYRYGPDMSFKGAFHSYGRADNEFIFVDRNTNMVNDSTLCLYTDFFNCTVFSIGDQGIYVKDDFRILDEARNNVIVLNDSLVFYRTMQEKYPFHVYNYASDESVCGFGDFPKSSIKPDSDADRDNICLSNSVYSSDRKYLVSFYESIPIIRIYDMSAYSLVKEIRVSDAVKQISSVDDYYEGRSAVYFLRPVATEKYIYSLFINDIPDNEIPEHTVLIKTDWYGNLLSIYNIDMYCPIYTVSESGIFYGISMADGEYVLCKTDLP